MPHRFAAATKLTTRPASSMRLSAKRAGRESSVRVWTGTIKEALAPMCNMFNRIAAATPELRRLVIARRIFTSGGPCRNSVFSSQIER